MADVNISKFRASVVREGSRPATPGFVVSEGQDPVNPPGTNNYVPYTGATANVELGEYGLEAGFVTLDTTPTNTPTDQGTIFWDADDETVDIVLNGYTMKIGEDLFYPVKNQTGSTIAKGTAVRFNGTVGASGRLLIAPFIADGSVPSSRFMGVTAEEILNGEDGKVLYFGRVRGINTNAFNEGDILYASTTVAGGYQTAIPVAPNNIVQVAAVVTKSATVGTIFVRPTLGSNINKDEGVKIVSVADKNLLQYQSGTGLWENKTLAQILGGTSSQFVKGDGSLDSTTYVSNVTASSPLFSSGGATPNITIQQASGSQSGFLSSTDWTTFNSKQNALTNPVTGTGTTNYLSKFTGASTIGNSLFTDNGTIAGVGNALTGNARFNILNIASNPALAIRSANNVYEILTMTFDESTDLFSITNKQAFAQSGIAFGTNNTQRLLLDVNGNLGLGVTPSAWSSAYKAIQFGQRGSVYSHTSVSATNLADNVFDDGVAKYIVNGVAGRYQMSAGLHQWFNAPSGTAGNAISFTQAMTLTSGGNLLVGTTTDNGARLQVSGAGGIRVNEDGSGTKVISIRSDFAGVDPAVNVATNNSLLLMTNNTERVRITNTGNVGIGTSSPGARLNIAGNLGAVVGAGNSAIRMTNTDSGNYASIGAGIVGVDNPGMQFSVDGTSRMVITGSGNVLIGTTTDNGARLQVSGDGVAFNFSTSNGLIGNINSSSANGGYVTWQTSGTTIADLGTAQQVFGAGGSDTFGINARGARSLILGTNNTARVTISSTGVATFSSSVTAGAAINLPNNFSLTGRNAANTLNISLISRNTSDRVIIDVDGYGTNIGGGGTVLINPTGGNVGIGTSSPNVKTEVAGTEAIVALRVTTDNGGVSASNYSEIQLADNGAVRSYWRNVRDGSGATLFSYNDNLRFLASGTEAARLTATRNLLVGTTTDNGARLQVSGTATVTGIGTFNNGTNSTNGIKIISTLTSSLFTGGLEFLRTTVAGGSKIQPLRDAAIGGVGLSFLVTANNTAEVNATYTSALQILNTGAATFSSSVTAASLISAAATFSNFGSATAAVVAFADGNTGFFRPALNTLGITTAGSERVRVTSSGNVLIGTTTDNSHKLRVNGTGYFDTGIKTGNPVGSTTNDWLLGRALVTGTSTPDRWIRVQIGNLYYDILAVYMGSV